MVEPFAYCMIARLSIAAAAARLEGWRPWLRTLAAALVAAGLLAAYDRRMVAFESTAPGGWVWWNDLRPLHALIWFVYAGLSASRVSLAWVALLVDAVVGGVAFLFRRELLFLSS